MGPDMAALPAKTSRRYLWVPRRLQVDIHYLIEGFEGMAMIRTLDSRVGLMEVMVSPGAEDEADRVIAALVMQYPQVKAISGKNKLSACPEPAPAAA